MAYISLNKAHTHHKTTINGQPTSQYSRYETGVITGNKRNLPAILADSTGSDGYGFDSAVGSDDDSWHVLNAFDSKGGYIDTIAVGGAMDADHAVVVAQTQLDGLGATSVALIGVGLTQFDSLNQSSAGTFSIDALNKLMDNPSQDKSYLPIITASELAYETDRVTFDNVQWGDNSDELLSHGGRDSALMLDMTRADTRSDLVNEFELADVLDLLGAEPEQSFDALMDTKNRLPLLKDRLMRAMVAAGDKPPMLSRNKNGETPKADPNKFYVTHVTETKPFKRQGVTNIAFVFDLSDGQKLSIWFHNPDSTPSKLMPSDIMISWKWMLNKRDVTAALSPKQGDNVQLPALASRIMRVAAKNSMRFKRTQARQLKLEQDLLDAQALVDTKTSTIEQLDQDIENLNTQIDAAMKAPKVEPIIEAKIVSRQGVDYKLVGKNSHGAELYEDGEGWRSIVVLGGTWVPEIENKEREDVFKTPEEIASGVDSSNPERDVDKNRELYSDDLSTLSDDELQVLYKKIDKVANKDDAWNKNMNALQNEGGEGFDFGGEDALKSSTRRREVKQEIDRRAAEPTNDTEADIVPASEPLGRDSEPAKISLDEYKAREKERNESDVKNQAERMGWTVIDIHTVDKKFGIRKVISNNSEYKLLYQKAALDDVIVMVAKETNANSASVSAWAKNDNGYYERLGEYDIEAISALNDYVIKRFNSLSLDNDNQDDLFDTDTDTDTDTTKPNNKKIVKGKSNKAKTPKGTKIESVFALVDAKFLVASHTANGSKNPKYPQELQPRDRARESSIAWVQKTSKELDPESLGRTGRVDTGAPIVGDDLVVESGNGRTIAIKMAYANGDASEYREWLSENADMFGMTAKQVESYKQPILVRMRTTQVNRSEFAVEANQDDKLSFTASERAKSDAKRVNAGMLDLFDPSESGDILAASNRDFVKSFLASLGATEAAQYTDSNGNPTQALVARIKGALFSKAYDDDRLLEMMADQTKPELQNTLNALTMAAPKFVAAQAVNRSDAQDLAEKVVDSVEQSLSDEVKNAIVDATNMIMNAKISNQDIKEYVLQQGLFEQVDDSVAELAVFLAANARSAKKMTDYFNAMASYIEQDSVSRQNLDMFGEPEPLSLADVIAHANNQVNDNTDTIGSLDMFNETVIDEPVDTAETTEPADDFNTANLAAKVDGIVNEINSSDFDPEIFDVDALSAIAEESEGNSELTAKLEAASEVYQNKLIAVAMQAMSNMAGN